MTSVATAGVPSWDAAAGRTARHTAAVDAKFRVLTHSGMRSLVDLPVGNSHVAAVGKPVNDSLPTSGHLTVSVPPDSAQTEASPCDVEPLAP